MAKVVEELRLVLKRRRDSESNDHYDMLATLLNEKSTTTSDGLLDDQIIDLLLSLLVAGYETTSTIMTLAIKFLMDILYCR